MTAASTISTRRRLADCRARGVCSRCPRRTPLPVYKGGHCAGHYEAALIANNARAARRREEAAAPVVAPDVLTRPPVPASAPPPPVPVAPALPAWLRGDTGSLPRVAPPLRRPT